MSWNEGQLLVANLQRINNDQPNDAKTTTTSNNDRRRTIYNNQYLDKDRLIERIRLQEDTIGRQQDDINTLKRSFNEMAMFVKQLETQLEAKFDEVDDNIEKLWYAPGGPAAAQLIVQYDHKNIIND